LSDREIEFGLVGELSGFEAEVETRQASRELRMRESLLTLCNGACFAQELAERAGPDVFRSEEFPLLRLSQRCCADAREADRGDGSGTSEEKQR
jgi:hypothetical protein